MLRRLVVLICLMSFAPASVGAQQLAAALMPKEVTEQVAASQSSSVKNVMVAVNDVADRAATDTAGQKETKSRPSCTFGEFFDIHFGGYRWLWWAGAAAALVAIHVAAD
ncbi:hypothetical protein LPW11_19260 [Geomonas sp. RF6]|uniref:hypothetical protein n=1 Tax=Geomonas sp. RF6 TaxID=2897342 RepID=UPI001E3F167B|nr:hypothetical protein [Geomonas sp. RF6]UFS70006.1 hypothetical protein LPW11_19260 [Geomonas sp. RF6]